METEAWVPLEVIEMEVDMFRFKENEMEGDKGNKYLFVWEGEKCWRLLFVVGKGNARVNLYDGTLTFFF